MILLRTALVVWLTTAGFAAAQEATRQVEPAKRGYLGVVTTPTVDGELIVSIDAQGPAAAAGIKVGDTLLKIDAQPITSRNSLRMQMQSKKAAQSVGLSVRDATGNVQEKSVTLRERPAAALNPLFPRSNYQPPDEDDGDWRSAPGFRDFVAQAQFMQSGPRPMLGVTVLDADPRLREQLKLGNAMGVVISEVRPNTPAADAKLQVNDLVQAIDNQPVTATVDLQRIVASAKPDSQVKLKILRGGQTIEVPVTVKTMTVPNMSGMPSGFSGMATAPSGDLVNQVNELKQRVAMLEARLQAMEQRFGGATGQPGVGGPPALKGTPSPPARGGERKPADR